MDKDALAPLQFGAFGFAFVEVGTVTPRPQPGNEKPRLWRILPLRAVRNRMGFNNQGAAQMARRLQQLRSTRQGRSLVLGVNLGKIRRQICRRQQTIIAPVRWRWQNMQTIW